MMLEELHKICDKKAFHPFIMISSFNVLLFASKYTKVPLLMELCVLISQA